MKQLKTITLLSMMAVSGFASASGIRPLEICGNVASRPGPSRTYTLSDEQFRALPQSSITTTTTWTPVSTFTGVKMEEIMRVTGAKGDFAKVYALDDYSVRIPVADFRRYGVVLARSMNGQPLKTSDFGPYFLIYPKDKFPTQLSTPTAEAKFVWQVSRIEFQ